MGIETKLSTSWRVHNKLIKMAKLVKDYSCTVCKWSEYSSKDQVEIFDFLTNSGIIIICPHCGTTLDKLEK